MCPSKYLDEALTNNMSENRLGNEFFIENEVAQGEFQRFTPLYS